jgi:hypothetical protein
MTLALIGKTIEASIGTSPTRLERRAEELSEFLAAQGWHQRAAEGRQETSPIEARPFVFGATAAVRRAGGAGAALRIRDAYGTSTARDASAAFSAR